MNDLIGVVAGVLLIGVGVACRSRSERIVHHMNRAAELNRHPITFSAGNIRRVSIFAVVLGLAMITLCLLLATGAV